MKKIRVLINSVLSPVGSSAARNVLRTENMQLVPVSITDCGNYRKFSINQVSIDLIAKEEICDKYASDILFNYGRPDVIVDYSQDPVFKLIIPDCLRDKTSFIFPVSDNPKQEVATLKKEIKGFGINIALLPKDPSEKEIIAAINFLYQKNEARIFGRVFLVEDMAA